MIEAGAGIVVLAVIGIAMIKDAAFFRKCEAAAVEIERANQNP